MNSSSKVPPRFVPTLTEVVQADAQRAESEAADSPGLAPDAALAGLEPAPPQPEQNADTELPIAAPLASFHTPWLADGLYVRRKPATIPRDLPPLPESLPPQQPFADSSGVSLDEVDSETVLESALEPGLVEPAQSAAVPEPESAEEQHLPVKVLPDESGCDLAAGHDDGHEAAAAVQTFAENTEDQGWSAQAPQVTEEYLVHRLMQRVDLVLEQRLQEAIVLAVQEQTRSMVLRLREEVESVVRQSVYEAVEAELAQQAQIRSEG
ncbi:hypothetical protein [Comamonas guangdongensis]|uniref:DUF2486 family protein n=1 Tax=Comamonas guangdongensis TaxID=510515 RepID=A0ABV3ZVY9_9BURK